MAKQKKLPDKLQIWLDARRRYRFSHAQVQMARELGLKPKKFGSLANHRQEPWKMPLPEYIEHLYFKRFGKCAPQHALSIEERLAKEQHKQQESKARKQERAKTTAGPQSGNVTAPARQPTVEQSDEEIPF